MKRTVQNILLVLALAIVPIAVQTIPVDAACTANTSSLGQVQKGIAQTGSNCSDAGVTGTIGTAVTMLSVVAGIAAVVMIVYSGYNYITSGGDSGKVSSAKTTLIYALVGLLIAALAQIIVHFVINTAKGA